MLKSRLLIVGLLAVPACTVAYPYASTAQPGGEWATSSHNSAALTTQDGTVVVFVVDEEALEELTSEAAEQGRTVVQVHVGTDSWTTDAQRPASTHDVAWAEPVEPVEVAESDWTQESRLSVGTEPEPSVEVTPAATVAQAAPEKVVSKPVTETNTPSTVAQAAPEKFVTAPIASTQAKPSQRANGKPQKRTYGWARPQATVEPVEVSEPTVTPVAEPVIESQPTRTNSAPAVTVNSGPRSKPVIDSSRANVQPTVKPTVEPVAQPVAQPSRPATETLRATGPGSQSGYTAYGTATGSRQQVNFKPSSQSAHAPSLLPLTPAKSTGSSKASTGNSSVPSKKKTTSSFWGPSR